MAKFGTVWIGIALTFFGCTMISVGLAVQKLSHQTEKRGKIVVVLIWILGFLSYLGGNLINMLALGFAPQALLAPLGSLTLVFNVVSSRIVLGERIKGMAGVWTLVIVLGLIVALVGSPKSEKEKATIKYMIGQLLYPPFLVYVVVCLMMVLMSLCTIVFTKLSDCVKRRREFDVEEQQRSFSVDSIFQRIMPENSLTVARSTQLQAISFAVLSALGGGNSFMLSKMVVEIMTNYESHYNTQPFMYAVIALMVVCSVVQIVTLNLGLSIAPALYIVPVFFCMQTVIGILSGGIFFQEFNQGPVLITTFGIGVLVTLAGVFLLTSDVELGHLEEAKRKSEDLTASLGASAAAERSLLDGNSVGGGGESPTNNTPPLEAESADLEMK